jgi:hypothetical protein
MSSPISCTRLRSPASTRADPDLADLVGPQGRRIAAEVGQRARTDAAQAGHRHAVDIALGVIWLVLKSACASSQSTQQLACPARDTSAPPP